MTSPQPALQVKDVVVELDGHIILDEISFSVDPGTTTAIIGPNGAGKSVLLRAILGLTEKKQGEVHMFGINHKNYRRAAALLSYIPQHLEFERTFPLTIRGLFSLKSSRPIGMSNVEESRMMELLKMVGTAHLANKRLNTLSGGQLQRILLAYSLMDRPKLLLLDEPSAGIDVKGQETIYSLLARIQTEENLTMVMVSHELQIVMNYADQVICLNQEIVCAGQPRRVLSNEILEQMYGTPVDHFVHAHDNPRAHHA